MSTVTRREAIQLMTGPAASGPGQTVTGLSATWDGGAAYLSRTDEGGESTWRLEVHVDIWDRPQIQGATRPDQGRRLVYELTGLAQIHGAAISRVR